jgi:hypothetical protein
VTQKDWDERWFRAYNELARKHPTDRAFAAAHEWMRKHHGERPPAPPDPDHLPLWSRIALFWLLSRSSKENPMQKRILRALVYAATAVYAVVQTSGPPSTPEGYWGLAGAFIIGFWGKFSSSKTIVAPNAPQLQPQS